MKASPTIRIREIRGWNRDTIPDIYDSFAKSIRTDTQYQTHLKPTPAHLRCCY